MRAVVIVGDIQVTQGVESDTVWESLGVTPNEWLTIARMIPGPPPALEVEYTAGIDDFDAVGHCSAPKPRIVDVEAICAIDRGD